jgi:mitofilin
VYYDFFSDRVPLGQSMLDFAEARGWDTITAADVVHAGSSAIVTTTRLVQRAFGKEPAEEIKREPAARQTAITGSGQALRIQTLPPPSKPSDEVQPEKKKAVVQDKKLTFSSDVQELVNKAEAALEKHVGNPTSSLAPTPTPAPTESRDTNVYDAPLPVGFEPPPGYRRPSPPSQKKDDSNPSKPEHKPEPTPVQLPLVAPAISALDEAEPIITHLAGTIDNLASYVATNPTAALKAADVLEEAKSELTSLVERIDKIKEEEKRALEAKMDEQTREYTLKLIEVEMEAQDRLDSREEDFKKIFEEERATMTEIYRQKLEQELKTQTELINERYAIIISYFLLLKQ